MNLLTFLKSITGIENLDECITLLDHHDWDLAVGGNSFPVFILSLFNILGMSLRAY